MGKWLFFTILLIFPCFVFAAAPETGVDTLDPRNRGYLTSFCAYHPASPICIIKVNPPVRPRPTEPEPVIPIPGGPLPILCPMPTACHQTVTGGTAQLQGALDNAECGCEVIVKPSTYGAVTYKRTCSAAKPLMVRAENASGVKLAGLKISGSYGIFQGFVTGGEITIDGDYNRVTRMLFTGTAHINVREGSTFNRIDHNDFIVDRASGGHATIGFFRPRSVAQMYNTNRIDTNYFTTNTPTPSSSVEGMAIFHCRYGAQDGYPDLSRFGSSKSIIENNLWENWGRKNVMEVKCSDNIFRNNTLVNSGRVLNRHGGRNIYQNNIFDNITTGLAIREFDNQVINNYFNRARLILYKGTRKYPDNQCFQARAWMPPGYQAPQGPPAVRTVLDKNRGPLSIGESEGAGCDVPVLNTKILCHEGGPVDIRNDVGTTGPTATSSCGFTMPKRLTRADVGRGAPEVGCSAAP